MKNRQLSAQTRKGAIGETKRRPWKKPEGELGAYDRDVSSFRALGTSAIGDDAELEARNGRFLQEESRLLRVQLAAQSDAAARLHAELDERSTEAAELTRALAAVKRQLREAQDENLQLGHDIGQRNLRISYLEDKLRTNAESAAKATSPIDGFEAARRARLYTSGRVPTESRQGSEAKNASETRLVELKAELEFCRRDNAKLQSAYEGLLSEFKSQANFRAEVDERTAELNRCIAFIDSLCQSIAAGQSPSPPNSEPRTELNALFSRLCNLIAARPFAERISATAERLSLEARLEALRRRAAAPDIGELFALFEARLAPRADAATHCAAVAVDAAAQTDAHTQSEERLRASLRRGDEEDEREQIEEFIQRFVDEHNQRFDELNECQMALLQEKNALLEEVNDLKIENQILTLEKMQIETLKKDFNELIRAQKSRIESAAPSEPPPNRGFEARRVYSLAFAARAERAADFEAQFADAQRELETRAYESVQLSARLADANERIAALVHEKSLLKIECAKFAEQIAALKSPNSNGAISLSDKTRNLELQTKLSQSEFDAQILKIRCANLESELKALRRELILYKENRRDFGESLIETERESAARSSARASNAKSPKNSFKE